MDCLSNWIHLKIKMPCVHWGILLFRLNLVQAELHSNLNVCALSGVYIFCPEYFLGTVCPTLNDIWYLACGGARAEGVHAEFWAWHMLIKNLLFSLVIHVAPDSLNKQEDKSEEMHCGKTWISSLGKTSQLCHLAEQIIVKGKV